MARDFWDKLKKPIFAIAPMANVTDAAFRRMFVECGRPTFFGRNSFPWKPCFQREKNGRLSTFGTARGTSDCRADLRRETGTVRKSGGALRELGFDGIDINMGCPDKDVEKQGAGAALMKNPRARETDHPGNETRRGQIAGFGENPYRLREKRNR